MKEIYFSIDIETDGMVPGLHSMLSFGAVAFDPETGEEFGNFYATIKPLGDAGVHKETLEWWLKPENAEGWKELHIAAQDAQIVMLRFDKWVRETAEKANATPVAAAWKPGFDIAFMRYYAYRYVGRDIFGRSGSGLDIKTVTALALGQKFTETQIGKVPREWTGSDKAHSHNALEDAIEQKNVLVNALKTILDKQHNLL